MQQQQRHAAIGAWTLTSSWVRPTSGNGDAAATISLEGSTSVAASLPADPVKAARRWLSDPEKSSRIDPGVRARALRAVDVAEQHLALLTELAAEFARAIDTDAAIDASRIAQADELATAMAGFSERLRTLLDVEHPVPDAAERLDRGLEAVETGGGLAALVACL